MKTMKISTALGLLSVFALTSGAQAQQAPSSTLDQTVTELRELAAEPAPLEEDRRSIARFLERSDVRGVADHHGIDLERVKDHVSTLDAEAASDLARRVDRVEDRMAQIGGDVVVISSTAIIIGLLVVLILVAA